MSRRLLFALVMTLLGAAAWLQAGVVGQAVAQASVERVDQRSVWQQPPGLESCHANWAACLEAAMRRSGATPQAMAYARRLKFEGYLSEFKHVGRVDMGTETYPFLANDNDSPVLLNGDPRYIDVWKDARKVDLRRNPTYASIKQQNPTASYADDPPRFVGTQATNSGGQIFIYAFEIKTCHACNDLGVAQVAFEFDAQGRYRGPRLLRLDRKSELTSPLASKLATSR